MIAERFAFCELRSICVLNANCVRVDGLAWLQSCGRSVVCPVRRRCVAGLTRGAVSQTHRRDLCRG